MKQKFVFTLLAFYCTIVFSQNLIPYPGFEANLKEEYTSFEQILNGWTKIMVSEPAYLITDGLNCNNCKAELAFSYVDSPPFNGNCYLYYYVLPGGRSFFQAKLNESLKEGKKYIFSCYINIINKFDYNNAPISPDAFSIYLHSESLESMKKEMKEGLYTHDKLGISTLFCLPSGMRRNDYNDWKHFSGVFTANAGENYLSIGNLKEVNDELFVLIIDNIELKEYHNMGANTGIQFSEPQKRMETFSSFDIPTRKIQSFSIFDKLLNSKDIPSIKYTHPEFFVTNPGIAGYEDLIKEFYSPAFSYLFESRGVSLFLLKLPQTLMAGKTYSINSAFGSYTNGEPRKNVDHNIFKIYFPSNKDTANVVSFFKSGIHTPESIYSMLKNYTVDTVFMIQGDRFPENYSWENTIQRQFVAKQDFDYILFGASNYRKGKYTQGLFTIKDFYIDEIEYAGIKLQTSEEQLNYRLDNMNFEINSDVIANSSISELNKIVAIMESNPDLNIKILGYTDDTGDKKYNIKLSKRRASGIADYLVSKGIEKKRIVTKGFGESNPVSDNTLEYGRLLNRRVEIAFF